MNSENNTVIIYGASDDLIEVEGAINEEFGFFNSDDEPKPAYLAFSDGTILSATYAELGIWRFHRVCAGSAEFKKVECEGDGSGKDYTDRVTLTGNIRGVVFGKEYAAAK